MRKFCLFMLFLTVMFMTVVFSFVEKAQSEPVSAPGVIANERVVNLPNDSLKWHLSIVGKRGEMRYENILNYFGPHGNLGLIALKKQVHFREIATHTVIFKERYAPNIKGLPTVRLQKHDGTVVYEAAGDNLPMSPGGLYGALANASSKAQGLSIFRPWGRYQRRGPCPDGKCPRVVPVEPEPFEGDPPPMPIDDGGAPEMSTKSQFSLASAGIGAGSALLCLFSGAGASLFVQWRRMYRQ